MQKKNSTTAKAPPAAIRRLHRKITAITLLCAGTLSERYKVCGHPNCRCATDPAKRHGPYYEWTRRENGRFVHSVVSPDQAKEIARAIANFRQVQALLSSWKAETSRLLGIGNPSNRQ